MGNQGTSRTVAKTLRLDIFLPAFCGRDDIVSGSMTSFSQSMISCSREYSREVYIVCSREHEIGFAGGEAAMI